MAADLDHGCRTGFRFVLIDERGKFAQALNRRLGYARRAIRTSANDPGNGSQTVKGFSVPWPRSREAPSPEDKGKFVKERLADQEMKKPLVTTAVATT